MSKTVYGPILPSKEGKCSRLLFNLIDKHQQVYASPELKYAIEEGYDISKIYDTFSYEKKGLFNICFNIFVGRRNFDRAIVTRGRCGW